MIRFLRALAWLRWRTLANALRRVGKRDVLGGLSQATEALLPALVLFFLIPPALGVGIAAFWAGHTLGLEGFAHPAVVALVRILLGAATAAVVVMPILRSTQGVAHELAGLALLPVPRRVLHLSEVLFGLADPWLAGILPGLLLLPLGLLAAGDTASAGVAFAAGMLLLAILALLGTVCTFLLHLLLRDRRRGELVTLLLLVALSLGGLIGGVAAHRYEQGRWNESGGANGRPEAGTEAATAAADRPAPRAHAGEQVFWAWSSFLPSEMYAHAIVRAAEGRREAALPRVAGLAILALALYLASRTAHRRILESPGAIGRRRAAGEIRVRPSRIPGLSPGSSAVALAWVRLVLRTVRGKMVVYFTPVSFLMLTLAFFGFTRGESGPPEGFPLQGGIVLAFLGVGFTLLSLQQVVLNQFALDRAGLSLQLLLPVTDRELVVGKAAGGAILGASAALLCVVPAVIVDPSGSPWLWMAVGAAGIGAYLLMAPVAAILSALFPKRADLSKLGRAGNPHAAAEIVGFLFYLALPLPPVVGIGLALILFESPRLAFLLMAGWGAACLLLALPLFRMAIWLLGNRRENVAMVVERG